MALICSIPLQVLILVFVSLVSLPCHQATNTILPNHNHATDRVSLISFKSAIFGDPNGVLSSWNDTVDFCRWQGITCSGHRHPGRVIALELASSDLVGIIPPAVANLTFLRRMDLSYNYFHGQIPLDIARMHRLQDLQLGHNSLSGKIPPELSHCKDLRTINFTYNMLEGSIPSELGLLFSLQRLDLNDNSITGKIPPSLANVSTITYLQLSNNQISGGIPPSLGKLSKFMIIDFSINYLEGAIPPSLWNISSLQIFALFMNQLYGTLPQDLGQTLPNLRFLEFNTNKFYGPIPMSLSNASSLQSIQLGKNNFSGIIPPNLGSLQSLTWLILAYNQLEAKGPNDWSFLSALTNCTRLYILQLDYNHLGSMLPNAVANLSSSLQVLTMGGNYIHGSIPEQIGNLVNLTLLHWGVNFLTGFIPNSIGLIKNLHQFVLIDNNLSGELPSTLGNLTQLTGIYFSTNSFNGSIPASLGNCQFLELLDLGQNMLTGSIPKEILAIPSLSILLRLEFNLLTGRLPIKVGGLINLDTLDVAHNKLSGEIPSNLAQCQVLQNLYLDHNFFQGSIPKSLSALRGLQELNLSQNNLSGEIPSFLEEIKGLYILNLSFNNFEGQVPSNGVFSNVSALSVLGNNKLCGGIPQLKLPACSFQSPKKKHHYVGLAAIVSVVGVFLLSFLVAAGYWISSSRRKPQEVTRSSLTELHLNVSYGQLVRATDGFSDANLLGSGHFGSVYKARLDDGNKTEVVAVKVLDLQQMGALKSFAAECDTLRSIRHRNLLKVLTACSSVDPQGNDFKALVFEFMANGSLENWLHSEANNSSAPKKLNLMQRLNIAIDVASALEYLHCHGQIPIVHCDLKPSNILLDEDLVAHLGDFGLARFLENVTNYSTDSFGLKGTIGYLAPEYGVGNKISILGDVYSYGVVLLEMFTGKIPTDDAFKDGLSLVRFVEMAFPDQVMSIMDPSMFLGEGSDDFLCIDDARTLVCVTSVLRIGLLCTKHLPTERMEMKAVSNELHSIRKTFLENKFREKVNRIG